MVARTRDQIYEDAAIADELEGLLESEDQALAALSRDDVESSRFIDERHSPTRLIRVYVKSTGEPRDVPAWTLEGKNSILRRRGVDGQREFVTRRDQADAVWQPGDVMCLLHPDHPRRKEFDAMGLRGKTCGALTGKHAGKLASEFALDIHMQHRHKAEWATIQRYEAKVREDEYREFQRLQAEAARHAMTSISNSHGTDWLDAMQSPVITEAIKGIAAESVRLATAKAEVDQGKGKKASD